MLVERLQAHAIAGSEIQYGVTVSLPFPQCRIIILTINNFEEIRLPHLLECRKTSQFMKFRKISQSMKQLVKRHTLVENCVESFRVFKSTVKISCES